MTGTEWRVDAVQRVVDGDTVYLVRSRDMQLGDEWYDVAEIKPKSIRLVWVDTPERGNHPGWDQARADLAAWIYRATDLGDLRVICYESAGWDRLLGDLIDADGNSASQYLMREKGWPAYLKGA